MTPLEQAADLIRSATRIAIGTHISPDGDAVGSMLALGRALSHMGKQPLLLCSDPAPQKLMFLPGADTIRDAIPADYTPELMIALDTSNAERLGTVAAPLLNAGIPTLVIDHHVTSLNFGLVNVVMPDVASTAEIVLMLMDALGVPLDEETATHLLAGIVTDTRSFSTSSVTADTLAATQRLMIAGSDLAYVTKMALTRKSIEALQLWGLGLSEMQCENGLLWTVLPKDRQEAAGISNTANGGLSNLLISAEEANVVAVFVELEDGRVDVSMRAAPGCDVSEVALVLGGGGHRLAAGCMLDGPLDEAVARTLALLREVAGR
jgi:phosphoesterase RecJ-like protein